MAVLDASVLVPAIAFDPRSDLAHRVLAVPAHFIAPDLLIPEVVNALWLRIRKNAAAFELARASLARLSHHVHIIPSRVLAPAALQIACNLDHPAYDSLYIALARSQGTVLVTFDERLLNKTRGTAYASTVVHPADFAASG